MPNNKMIAAALIWLICCLGAAAVLALAGCTKMIEADRAFWGTGPTVTYTVAPDGTKTLVESQPGRPGWVEVLAAALGALGLTGTAAWISRVKKQANGKTLDLEHRLDALEAKLPDQA